MGRDTVVTRQQRLRSIRRLVRMLRGVQRDEKLSTRAMARKLGVSCSMLCMVYSGKRAPGRKFESSMDVYRSRTPETSLWAHFR